MKQTARRLGILLLAWFMISLNACQVYKQAAQGILLPSDETLSMASLSKDLSRALKMSLSPEDNLLLYAFVADWLGTPYRYGASSIKGTDCSGFVYRLYAEVYEKALLRSSANTLLRQVDRISRTALKEGDLVFFNINPSISGASHVGVYLRDGQFVHASTSEGVKLSALDEPYYRQHYLAAGRLRSQYSQT